MRIWGSFRCRCKNCDKSFLFIQDLAVKHIRDCRCISNERK